MSKKVNTLATSIISEDYNNKNDWTTLTVITNDSTLYFPKNKLIKSSEYFAKMFRIQMAESKDNVLTSFEEYPSSKIIALFSMIEDKNKLTSDTVFSVIEIINYFQFSGLMDKAIEVLKGENSDTCWYINEISLLFNEKFTNGPYADLMQNLLNKILDNYINYLLKYKQTLSETIEELIKLKNEELKTRLLTKCMTRMTQYYKPDPPATP
jgi:hypothetical protein